MLFKHYAQEYIYAHPILQSSYIQHIYSLHHKVFRPKSIHNISLSTYYACNCNLLHASVTHFHSQDLLSSIFNYSERLSCYFKSFNLLFVIILIKVYYLFCLHWVFEKKQTKEYSTLSSFTQEAHQFLQLKFRLSSFESLNYLL